MATWTPPKTDWNEHDRFNISDFMRIKNNNDWLTDKCNQINPTYGVPFWQITSTYDPAVSSDYKRFWDVDDFNSFGYNIQMMNYSLPIFPLGDWQRKVFHENGLFIDYVELNRIESAHLVLHDCFASQMGSLKRLPFILRDHHPRHWLPI